MTDRKRGKRLFKGILVYGAIVLVTLALLDAALMLTGLFPPTHEYGHPELGWVAAPSTGRMEEVRCLEFSRNQVFEYLRNEDGYRTSHSSEKLAGRDDLLEIAVTGDSHTDLCAPSDSIHFGVTEAILKSAGREAAAFSNAAGRYSPLQAYLAVAKGIDAYSADVLVLNLYTGNDFYDMIRVDDRPHLVSSDSGYRIADPVWYQYDPPDLVRRSRVLFALRSLADATGVRGALMRVRYLRETAADQGAGIGDVLKYINDLRKSAAPDVGYSGAFAAQILNQQLFFHHFPESRAEALRRVAALLELIRDRHPELLLVMSPIPSYQAVIDHDVDESLSRVLDRLPVTYEEGAAQERAMYYELEKLATERGWLFVDNLSALRAYSGGGRLYNDFDYHIEPIASRIIGVAQAEALLDASP